MIEESQPEAPRETSLAESPLFWIALFAAMAVLALAAIGPKYARRQAGLVNRYEARSQAQGGALQPSPTQQDDDAQMAAESGTGQPRTNVRPIAIALGAVVVAALSGLLVARRRKQRLTAVKR